MCMIYICIRYVKYVYHICCTHVLQVYMSYMCNTPKTPHMYYICTTYVLHCWHISYLINVYIPHVLHMHFYTCNTYVWYTPVLDILNMYITIVVHMYYRCIWVTCVIHIKHHICIIYALHMYYTYGTFPNL